MLETVKLRSVIDIGCRVGKWTLVLQQLAGVSEAPLREIVSVDGDWVPEERRGPSCVVHDLEQPLTFGRGCDFAISMEVPEHLPSRVADRFVASLVSLAPAVFFPAATPFQGGTGYVNMDWQSSWANRFAAHGYFFCDVVRPRVWTEPDVAPWYAQNALLYLTEPSSVPAALDLVHPRHYLHAVEEWSVRRRARIAQWHGATRCSQITSLAERALSRAQRRRNRPSTRP